MGKAWQGKYRFEKGDVVRILKPHPYAGRKGTVEIAFGSNQFGVTLTPTWIYCHREVTCWGNHLDLIASGE